MGMVAVGAVILFAFLSNGAFNLVAAAISALPVAFMLAAMNLLVFNLAGNLVSGLLLHFFSALALCYVSGCVYPATAFPVSVQKLAALLPTGIARQHLAAGVAGASDWGTFVGLLAYCGVFFSLALLVRYYKTTRVGR